MLCSVHVLRCRVMCSVEQYCIVKNKGTCTGGVQNVKKKEEIRQLGKLWSKVGLKSTTCSCVDENATLVGFLII